MSEPIILSSQGVFKGPMEKGVQYYHAVGVDGNKQQYIMVFGTKPNFAEAIDKSFERLAGVKNSKKETPADGTKVG